jgi:hypothetical protein
MVLIGLLLLGFIVNEAFAEEPILVLESNAFRDIDGKWTFVSEWKESGDTQLSYNNGGKLILRTAHDRNYIYVLVDHVGDTSPNKGKDRATICLNGNSKNTKPEKDDYCFIVTLGRINPVVLQGGSPSIVKSNFKRIFETGFEGMGGVTVTDRYSVIPHVTYEFKIPVDLVGRSNEYQFYVAVYESDNYVLTWPKYITLKSNFAIPPPSNWGTMISPDKSLPEFHFLYFVFFVPFLMIIILRMQRWRKLVNFS